MCVKFSLFCVFVNRKSSHFMIVELLSKHHSHFHPLSIRKYISSLFHSETAASDIDTIILAPPPSLSVSEGNSVLIPCVGSAQQPGFTGGSPAATSGTPSSFGLMISSADREDSGTIVCQVGGASSEVNLTVYGECFCMTSL